jgi:hypothetical protein
VRGGKAWRGSVEGRGDRFCCPWPLLEYLRADTLVGLVGPSQQKTGSKLEASRLSVLECCGGDPCEGCDPLTTPMGAGKEYAFSGTTHGPQWVTRVTDLGPLYAVASDVVSGDGPRVSSSGGPAKYRRVSGRALNSA